MPDMTPSNPETALVNLNLRAVALVKEGANSRANILLTKGKENTKMPITFEEITKALNPEQAQVVTAHLNSLEIAKNKALSDANEKVTALTAELDLLKKVPPVVVPVTNPEDVLKNASPEVKALVEKMQGQVNSLVASQEEVIAKDRFEKVKAIPVDEPELKEVLKSASPKVMAILEKAAAAIAAGLVAKGSKADGEMTGSSADDQYAKLEKSARDIQKATEGMTFEKAFSQACIADPDTYKKYVEGVK